eukprot:7501237-Pyramimonas_sp.AAC.1
MARGKHAHRPRRRRCPRASETPCLKTNRRRRLGSRVWLGSFQGLRGPSSGCHARPAFWTPAVKAPPSGLPPSRGLQGDACALEPSFENEALSIQGSPPG